MAATFTLILSSFGYLFSLHTVTTTSGDLEWINIFLSINKDSNEFIVKEGMKESCHIFMLNISIPWPLLDMWKSYKDRETVL